MKEKPRFKAAAQIEKEIKKEYAEFLGNLLKQVTQNVQIQSSPSAGVDPGDR